MNWIEEPSRITKNSQALQDVIPNKNNKNIVGVLTVDLF